MKRIDVEQPVQPQSHNMPQMYAPYYDDEISLVDLWLVLLKHKKTILYVLIAAILLAITVTVFKKQQYEFVSVVEIGRIPSDEGFEYVDSLESSKEKLEKGYIPFIMAGLDKDERAGYKVTINLPKGTHLLEVKTKNTADNKQLHHDFHTALIGKLIEEQNLLSKNFIDQQLATVNIQKQGLKKYITTQTEFLSQIKDKVKQEEVELKSLKKQFKNSRGNKEAVSLAEAGIKDLYDQMMVVSGKVESEILLRKTSISNIDFTIEKVSPTKYVVPFYQSVDAKGLSRKIIFVLIVFVGFVFAIIAAFVAEFSEKVKEKIKQQDLA